MSPTVAIRTRWILFWSWRLMVEIPSDIDAVIKRLLEPLHVGPEESVLAPEDEAYLSSLIASVRLGRRSVLIVEDADGRWLRTGDIVSVDEDGYVTILGRTDDVINVAGHRLGTREIEEALSSHAAVAEVAVVGVTDALKGQAAMAFVVLRGAQAEADPSERARLEAELTMTVERQLGAIARPARVVVVSMLPKTRSGKLLRRAIAALAEGREPGDLPTIEDPAALQQVREALGGKE